MYKSFAAVTLTALVLDAGWLFLNRDVHTSLIKAVQKADLKIRYIPALVVYILIPLAVFYFAVMPSKTSNEAMKNGALIGASMYGLYDFTNLSTLNGWTTEFAIKDTLWGTVLCSASALAGFLAK
jgi:uncharacterized membrane protein